MAQQHSPRNPYEDFSRDGVPHEKSAAERIAEARQAREAYAQGHQEPTVYSEPQAEDRLAGPIPQPTAQRGESEDMTRLQKFGCWVVIIAVGVMTIFYVRGKDRQVEMDSRNGPKMGSTGAALDETTPFDTIEAPHTTPSYVEDLAIATGLTVLAPVSFDDVVAVGEVFTPSPTHSVVLDSSPEELGINLQR